ncbi:MAG: DUF401 family protein [Thaumarchaeota archaeon]|jgi:integral membrane protein (TIGR00529 family)|nr:DUF401 family protein [Candidatus Terraquivivens yellowstonensis]
MEQLIFLIVTLVAILIAIVVFKINIGISLFLGTLFFGFITQPFPNMLNTLFLTLTNETTVLLLIISIEIVFFVNIYSATKMIDEAQSYIIRKVRKPKLIAVMIPSFLGLLPIAGGALLSAPFVDKIGNDLGLSRGEKVFINVWYRHALLFAYPINDALVLTVALASIKLSDLIPVLLPSMLIMFTCGFPLLIKRKEYVTAELVERRSSGVALVPFMLAVIVATILSIVLNMGFYGIVLGTMVGIISTLLISRPKGTSILRSFMDKRMITIALVLYSAMLLRGFIASTSVPASINMLSLMLPRLTIEVLLPFFLGYMLASISGAVALSFVTFAAGMTLTVYEVALIYGSAFIGYTVSPFHLCLVFTAECLKTNITSAYKYMLPAALVTILSLIALTFI